VTGNGMPAGDAIVRHPRVKRICFTGSIPTGMAIQRSAAEGGIKALTLELGGKNPFIVYPDADPDKVADAAIAGMNFAWSGQSCGSTSRLMLHETLYKKVIDRVTEKVAEIKMGDPMDMKSQMGPDELQAPHGPRQHDDQVWHRRWRQADDRRQTAARQAVRARILDRADRIWRRSSANEDCA